MAAAHAASTGATPRIVRVWKRICPSRRGCRLPTPRATKFYKRFNTLTSPSGRAFGMKVARHSSDPLEPTVHWGPRGRDCDDGLPSKEVAMAARMQEPTSLPARLETLLEVSRQFSRIQPLDALLGSMAEACGSLLDSDSVGIRVVDGDDLVLMGVWGDAHRAMPTPRIKIGESLTGTVVATGKPLLLSDPANDPRIAPASRIAYLRGGYRAFLGVPLKVGDQVLGALSIRTLRAEGFSSEDVSIATAFAAQAAIALENARLYREAEARADKLKALSALTRLMTSAEGASEVCQAVARAATSLLGADR